MSGMYSTKAGNHEADDRLLEWAAAECLGGNDAACSMVWRRLVTLLGKRLPPDCPVRPIQLATAMVAVLHGDDDAFDLAGQCLAELDRPPTQRRGPNVANW